MRSISVNSRIVDWQFSTSITRCRKVQADVWLKVLDGVVGNLGRNNDINVSIIHEVTDALEKSNPQIYIGTAT